MRSHECDCPRFAEFFEPMSTWLSKNSVIPQASSSRSWISSVFDFIWGQVSLFRLPNVSTRSMAPAQVSRASAPAAPTVPRSRRRAYRSAELAPPSGPSVRSVTHPLGPSVCQLSTRVLPLLILSHLIFINCNRTHGGLATRLHKRCGTSFWTNNIISLTCTL